MEISLFLKYFFTFVLFTLIISGTENNQKSDPNDPINQNEKNGKNFSLSNVPVTNSNLPEKNQNEHDGWFGSIKNNCIVNGLKNLKGRTYNHSSMQKMYLLYGRIVQPATTSFYKKYITSWRLKNEKITLDILNKYMQMDYVINPSLIRKLHNKNKKIFIKNFDKLNFKLSETIDNELKTTSYQSKENDEKYKLLFNKSKDAKNHRLKKGFQKILNYSDFTERNYYMSDINLKDLFCFGFLFLKTGKLFFYDVKYEKEFEVFIDEKYGCYYHNFKFFYINLKLNEIMELYQYFTEIHIKFLNNQKEDDFIEYFGVMANTQIYLIHTDFYQNPTKKSKLCKIKPLVIATKLNEEVEKYFKHGVNMVNVDVLTCFDINLMNLKKKGILKKQKSSNSENSTYNTDADDFVGNDDDMDNNSSKIRQNNTINDNQKITQKQLDEENKKKKFKRYIWAILAVFCGACLLFILFKFFVKF